MSTTKKVLRSLGVDVDSGTLEKPGITRSFTISPLDMWVHDAWRTPLPATSSSDDLGCYGTFGTDALRVSAGSVSNVTDTGPRYARFAFIMPPDYRASQPVTVQITMAGDADYASATTAEIDVVAYDSVAAPTTDICATAAQDLTGNTADTTYTFTITDAGLAAGDTLDVRLNLDINNGSGSGAIVADIDKVAVVLGITA